METKSGTRAGDRASEPITTGGTGEHIGRAATGVRTAVATDGARRRLRCALRSRGARAAGAAAIVLLLAAGAVVCDVRAAGSRIVRQPASAPQMPVAIVFGAGYTEGGPSAILYDRVAVAAQLYRAGRARKLLMSGDNSRAGYSEPETMRQTAVRLGVPARDIVLDYAGFRTYDSLYRARDVFGVRRALLVSQAYHLPRALFLARHLGIDAAGVAADRRPYEHQTHLILRELLADESAWLDVHVLRPRPHFLGRPEPIAP